MRHYYEYYFYGRQSEMDYPVNSRSCGGRDDRLFDLLSTNPISVCEYRRTHKDKPLTLSLCQSFQTAAQAFQAIDSPTQGVIVPYDEGEIIIGKLCSTKDAKEKYKLIHAAQRYSVNLFSPEWKKLVSEQAIHEVQEGMGVYYLENQYYSPDFGLSAHRVSEMPFLNS
jgi:CRISPR-associated endonuclease/helicase Cas3